MQSWYVKGRSWAGALHGSDNGELAKEHEGWPFKASQRVLIFASKRRAIKPTQEDAWRDDLVREFYSEACMCIFWPYPKEKPTSTGVRWLVAKSGVRAVARDKTDRKEDRRAGS